MSVRKLQTKKVLIRRQIMNDIHELNMELSSLRDILRMKQCLLRKTNQEIFRLSQASSYLALVPGKKSLLEELSLPANDTENETTAVQPQLTLIKGGVAG